MPPADLLAADRFAAALGVRLVVAETDRIAVEMTIGPRHLDATGGVSTGALFSLADCAMSLVSNAEQTAVAVATHFIHHGGASPGDVVRAEAVPGLPPLNRTDTWSIILTSRGETIATFTGTTYRLRTR